MSRWNVVEHAVYEDCETSRVVESGLRRRAAVRSAAEWQAASLRSRLMVEVMVPASKRKPLPTVTYLAEVSS